VTPEALAQTLARWLPAAAEPVPVGSPQETPDDSMEAADLPVWDRAGMLGRLLDDKELAHTICEAFLGDIPGQIEALRDQLGADDLPAAERQAHTIKGASSYVGAERLRAVAAAIENAARAADPEGCRERVDSLESEFRNVARNMRQNSSGKPCPEQENER
jgi:HPt (histidine-containing phosphotransfer) domain-containing protein